MTAALVALVEVIILMMWVASFSFVISPLFLYCCNKVSFYNIIRNSTCSIFYSFVWCMRCVLYYWIVAKWMLSCGDASLLVDFMLFHDWLVPLHHHHMLLAEELDGRELGCCWMVSLELLLVQQLPRKELNLTLVQWNWSCLWNSFPELFCQTNLY